MSKKMQCGLFAQVISGDIPESARWAPDIYPISRGEALGLIQTDHYAKGIHNGPMAWGGFLGGELRAVCAFATPCSENVRASLFGREHVDAVTELHRLAVKVGHPRNYTSWFVRQCLNRPAESKPGIRGVISFADETEGHTGAIYKALNFEFAGKTGRARFWRDADGRLRHPRQAGVNVSEEEARALGWSPEWRDSKLRFVTIVGPDKRERKAWRKKLKIKVEG